MSHSIGSTKAFHGTEALFDGGDHQVADVLGGDAAGGGDVPYGFPVAAIEREGYTDLLAIAAADFQRIGAPACIALPTATRPLWRRSPPLPLWGWSSRPWTFSNNGRYASGSALRAWSGGPGGAQGIDAPVAIGWQIGD
ncbi:hypothetical protein ABIC44_003886 [Sphingomonas sp. 1185]